jgi:tetratricopeptide (TPR) repeat protein
MEHPALYARLLNWMARKISLIGDDCYARSLLEESQALWLKLGVEGEQGLAEALDFLGEIIPNSDASQSLLQQSFELYQKHGNHWGMARVMFSLGHRALWQGNYVEAEKQLIKSLAKFQELGDNIEISRVLNILGELARMQDHYEQAGKYYEQAIKIEQELHQRLSLSYCLWNLGWVTLHANDYQRTRALFKESFEVMSEDGNLYGMFGFLLGFAGIFGMTGKPEQAARLFGAFDQLSKSSSRPLDPPDQKEFNDYVALVRAQLDEATFAKAWADGCEITLEQAIAFVRKETDE